MLSRCRMSAKAPASSPALHRLVALPLLVALTVTLAAGSAAAAEPWPGETWQESAVLTSLDSDFRNNLSGAFWNAETRTLWVCINGPGRFWALVEDGQGGFVVDQRDGRRAEWSISGDIEGITQADPLEPAVYVVNEALGAVEKYDISVYGAPVLLQRWDLSAHVGPADWAGAEGLTFVPDAWLAHAGFTDATGQPYTSHNGMGGLFFVAHQHGGLVHVFDLVPGSDAYDFVGSFRTSRGESSGLEFDRSSGALYIWHNTGANYLEVSDLTSFVRADGQRQLTTVVEFTGPRSGNLEGVAVTPAATGEGWCFFVDDDNQDGGALSWYRDCAGIVALPPVDPPPEDPTPPDEPVDPPEDPAGEVFDVRVQGSNDDAEEAADGTIDLTSTDLELTEESSRQTVGVRFRAVYVPRRARVLEAWLQFTVDETASVATALTIHGEAAASAAAFGATPGDITRRPRTAASVAWSPAAWGTVGRDGADQRTPDLSAIVQELVDRDDWAEGSAMVFLVTGAGKRVAESYDGVAHAAPLLHVVFEEVATERVIDACATEWCDPETGCVLETLSCDDGDACTADACDPEAGCVSTPLGCDDGDACTTDTCDAVTGCAWAPVACDDGDACTADACDPAVGCTATPIACDDGNACTMDACDPAVGCTATPIACDDGDACTVDVCDPETGCVFAPVACDDGDACTVDVCDPAVGCAATPIVCNDGDPCTADACDPATGCVFAPIAGCGAESDDAPHVWTGVVTSASGWTHVALAHTYDELVVVCAPRLDRATGPLASRVVRALDGAGFAVAASRGDGAFVAGVTLDCVAVEAGAYAETEYGIALEAAVAAPTWSRRDGRWTLTAPASAFKQPLALHQPLGALDLPAPPEAAAKSLVPERTVATIVVEAATGLPEGTPTKPLAIF